MIGHGIYFSGSEDIKHPPVGFFDGAKLHKGHFALSLSSFEAAPYSVNGCFGSTSATLKCDNYVIALIRFFGSTK